MNDIVKGGQGREPGELVLSAVVFLVCLLAAILCLAAGVS